MSWEHTIKAVGAEAGDRLERELSQQDMKGSAALAAAVRAIGVMYPDKQLFVTTYGYFDEDGGICTLNCTVGNPKGGLVPPIYRPKREG